MVAMYVWIPALFGVHVQAPQGRSMPLWFWQYASEEALAASAYTHALAFPTDVASPAVVSSRIQRCLHCTAEHAAQQLGWLM
jgi:hypothetical protein